MWLHDQRFWITITQCKWAVPKWLLLSSCQIFPRDQSKGYSNYVQFYKPMCTLQFITIQEKHLWNLYPLSQNPQCTTNPEPYFKCLDFIRALRTPELFVPNHIYLWTGRISEKNKNSNLDPELSLMFDHHFLAFRTFCLSCQNRRNHSSDLEPVICMHMNPCCL